VGSRLTVAIMAHPRRRRWIEPLRQQLPMAETIFDERNNIWDTGRRCLLSGLESLSSTHHMIIQDDAILHPNLVDEVLRAIDVVTTEPISLYTGRARPRSKFVEPAVKLAKEIDARWIVMSGPWWGVGIVLPKRDIPGIIARGDRMSIINYDLRIAKFYEDEKRDCWYTSPSLVEHRPVEENPSLAHRSRTGRRQAWYFTAKPIGDWRGPVVRRGQPDYAESEAVRKRKFDALVGRFGLEVHVPKGVWIESERCGTYRIGETIIKGGRTWVTDPFVIRRLREGAIEGVRIEEDAGRRIP
jgi:hypothetical protein